MGKKSGTQTVDQSPWGPAQPSLQFGLKELNRIYAGGGPTREQFTTTTPGFRGGQMGGPFTPWVGQRMPSQAPSSSFDQAGYDRALAEFQAREQTPLVPEYGLLDPAAAELMSTIKGERLFQNPHLDEVIRRASADVNSQFAGMSRYGSGAHADSLFTRAAAPIRYADYAQERANQLSAVGQAPGFEMAPYQMYSARQAAPYEGIRNYLDLVNPIGGQGGTESQPIYKNPLAGALGGAAAGAGLATAMSAPVTWPYLLGGALLGGFGS